MIDQCKLYVMTIGSGGGGVNTTGDQLEFKVTDTDRNQIEDWNRSVGSCEPETTMGQIMVSPGLKTM
jgi:hypothetical protein